MANVYLIAFRPSLFFRHQLTGFALRHKLVAVKVPQQQSKRLLPQEGLVHHCRLLCRCANGHHRQEWDHQEAAGTSP